MDFLQSHQNVMDFSLRMVMKTIGVIPARYASSRFPGKPLAMIAGKPMIQRVYERASGAESLDEVLVVTDDKRIAEFVTGFGGHVKMTSPACSTGTDRVAEAVAELDEYQVVVNIQGDEPLLEPENIDTAVRLILETPEADMTTLVRPAVEETGEMKDPNRVKAVCAGSGRVLYFSRAHVPYITEAGGREFAQGGGDMEKDFLFIHIGLYVYRRTILLELCSMPRAGLEVLESLEQLRALDAGMSIFAARVEATSAIGVDVPGDVARVEHELKRAGLD
ncbi:MAG: 3-deoxy-manno-octulosonate cytidylyltransferase [Gemmatimonadota bacterium]|nr:3-deoxy-manno-octulosonate cytidylyltransferase [Gemmatimonadota bacterium]